MTKTFESASEELHHAAIANDTNLIKTLLDQGAKIDYPRQNGRTALHFACMHNHKKALKLLLEKGASIEPCFKVDNSDEYFPSGHTRDMGSRIFKTGIRPIDIACLEGSEEILKLLLEHEINIQNIPKGYHERALLFMTISKQYNMAEIFRSYGIEVKDTHNNFPTELKDRVAAGDERYEDAQGICTVLYLELYEKEKQGIFSKEIDTDTQGIIKKYLADDEKNRDPFTTRVAKMMLKKLLNPKTKIKNPTAKKPRSCLDQCTIL